MKLLIITWCFTLSYFLWSLSLHINISQLQYIVLIKSLSTQGCKIGHNNINAVACAYDIAVLSDSPYDLQILINHAQGLCNIASHLHPYTLQAQKKCNQWGG